jgi:short-subunit dehydrogenase
MKKVALITGASSGIGFETAHEMLQNNFVVYVGARRVERLKELESQGAHIIELDVTDDKSMTSCIDTIIANEGQIDILVNNAGYGSYGAVEDVPMSEARRQLEVNVFGLARMTQLVLPHMREKKEGRIINISSIGGKVHTPFGAWYHATKFAVEGFSDCLRVEVAPFGIDVVLVEPGGIKTPWGTIAAENLKESSTGGAYEVAASSVAQKMTNMYTNSKSLSSPKLIAHTIVKAATKKRAKTRYLIGMGAKPLWLLRRVLTDRAYDKIIMRIQG